MKNRIRKMACRITGLGLMLLLLTTATAQAQNLSSSKVTAKTSSLVLLPKTSGTAGWQTVLFNMLKTA